MSASSAAGTPGASRLGGIGCLPRISLKTTAEKEGISCQIIQRRAEQAFQVIIDEAAKNKADLIVMGRMGRTELRRLLMGGVIAKVIGHAPCLVLVVPRSAQLSFKKILIATDG